VQFDSSRPFCREKDHHPAEKVITRREKSHHPARKMSSPGEKKVITRLVRVIQTNGQER
jgi:hypothetical protein